MKCLQAVPAGFAAVVIDDVVRAEAYTRSIYYRDECDKVCRTQRVRISARKTHDDEVKELDHDRPQGPGSLQVSPRTLS